MRFLADVEVQIERKVLWLLRGIEHSGQLGRRSSSSRPMFSTLRCRA